MLWFRCVLVLRGGMVALTSCAMFASSLAHANVDELLVSCLRSGDTRCVAERDPDYTFKSLFLSFSDDDGLNHGHAMARLSWRMTRELTYSLANTKNLFSYELAEGDSFYDEDFFGETRPGLEAVAGLTALEFHDAARRLGSELTAQAVIWGEHYRSGSVSALRTSMTLIDDFDRKSDSWLRVPIEIDGVETAFRLPAWEFDFTPTFGLIEDSFERQFVLRCNENAGCTDSRGIELYATPSNASREIIQYLPTGERVLGRDVVQKWVYIERENGETGYVNIYHLEVVPTHLRYEDRKGINIRQGPGKNYPAIFQADLNGVFPVLRVSNDVAEPGDTSASQRANDQIHGNWYKIDIGNGTGWVKGYIPTSGSNNVAAESHIGQRDKALYLLAAMFRSAVANSTDENVRWQRRENLFETLSLLDEFRVLADPELDNQAIAFSHMMSALTHQTLLKRFEQVENVEAPLIHAREATRNLPLFPEPRLLYAYLLLDTQNGKEAQRQFELALGLHTPESVLDWNVNFACDSGLETFCLP